MSSHARRLAGYVTIAAGLILMPMPILPGIPIVLAGIAMLGADHPLSRWLKGHIDRFRKPPAPPGMPQPPQSPPGTDETMRNR